MRRITLFGIALTLMCTQGCVRRAPRRPSPPQYPPPHQQYPPPQYPPPQYPPPPQQPPPQQPPPHHAPQPRPAQPQPAQPPARTGAGLEISSDPPAAVLLNGRPVGVTPLTVQPLAPGQYDVTFMMPVQGNVTLTVELEEGEFKRLHHATDK